MCKTIHWKTVLSTALAICLLAVLLPTTGFANETGESTEIASDTSLEAPDDSSETSNDSTEASNDSTEASNDSTEASNTSKLAEATILFQLNDLDSGLTNLVPPQTIYGLPHEKPIFPDYKSTIAKLEAEGYVLIYDSFASSNRTTFGEYGFRDYVIFEKGQTPTSNEALSSTPKAKHKTSTLNQTVAPKTGDVSKVAFLSISTLLSLTGIVFEFIRRKKVPKTQK